MTRPLSGPPAIEDAPCPRCKGDGYLSFADLTPAELDEWAGEDEREQLEPPCPDCNGSGENDR